MNLTKIIKDEELPGCSLENVDNKQKLCRRKISLVDIKCTHNENASKKCHQSGSYIIYRCINGYKFLNSKGLYLRIVEGLSIN